MGGRRPQSVYGPIDKRNDVTITLPLEAFAQRNIAADFFRQKLKITGKTAKSRFAPPFGGLRGNVQCSCMARWKPCCQLPISVNCTYFASSHG